MRPIPSEFEVYQRLIQFLNTQGWRIICASPPAGTNGRYRKCLLPRRELGGNRKGPRDELDTIAHDNDVILLIECKPCLSDSFQIFTALDESDYMKLKRIANSFSPNRLSELLQRATGISIPEKPRIALSIAVGFVDFEIPSDMTVMEFGSDEPRIWAAKPLLTKFV